MNFDLIQDILELDNNIRIDSIGVRSTDEPIEEVAVELEIFLREIVEIVGD